MTKLRLLKLGLGIYLKGKHNQSLLKLSWGIKLQLRRTTPISVLLEHPNSRKYTEKPTVVFFGSKGEFTFPHFEQGK